MRIFLIALVLMAASCKTKAPDQIYCQGFVEREIITTPEGEQLSRTFTLKCNGQCPDGKLCEILKKEFNPVQPNGLVKEEWCGCAGDTIPQGCDIILKTYNINGRIIQQADCTAFNTCPIPSDTCLQAPDRNVKVDTIRKVNKPKEDSLYKHSAQLSCSCN